MASYEKKQYRGIALVIGNEIFHTKVGQKNIDRQGCKEDIKMMKNMFEKLDFFVMCYKDLIKEKMEEKISKVSKDPRNKDCECFVLVLSTHGQEVLEKNEWHHEVMGSDRNYLRVEDILRMFDKENATHLAGKPKFFFIQACRVKDSSIHRYFNPFDEGVKVRMRVSAKSDLDEKDVPKEFTDDQFRSDCDELYKGWEMDPECWFPSNNKNGGPPDDGGDASGEASGDAGGSADSDSMPPEPVDILKIKCPVDCLLYYPVVTGKLAFRSKSTGSYMIYYMWKQFPKLLRGYNLKQYFTYVNRAMSKHVMYYQHHEFKVTACFVDRMKQNIIFEPKSIISPMAKAMRMI